MQMLIDTDDTCYRAWSLPCSFRPASIWLSLCHQVLTYQYIIKKCLLDGLTMQGLEKIGALYPELFETQHISHTNSNILQKILRLIPEGLREEALQIIAQDDERRIAHLLVCLASAELTGFRALVQNIMAVWHK